MSSNGGRIALSGFLYQFIGTLGISAIIETSRRNPGLDELIISLLNIEESSKFIIEPEKYEDALIRKRYFGVNPSDDCVFIQFKYSDNPSKSPIYPAQLKKILKSFTEHVNEATKNGYNITACLLVTNRLFSKNKSGGESTQKIWSDAKRKAKYRLDFISEIDSSVFEENLRTFSNEYGILNNEFDRGISILIGELLIEAAGKQFRLESGVFKEKMLSAFTDEACAESLKISRLQEKFALNIENFETYLRIETKGRAPIERHQLVQDLNRALKERAIINLYGEGGNGKSVLLRQLIRAHENATAYSIYRATDISSNLISKIVNHEWRNLKSQKYSLEETDLAIDRLIIANQENTPPILFLGLDGLDEDINSQKEEYIKALVRWFWKLEAKLYRTGKEYPAKLIVTCRTETQLRDFLSLPYDLPILPFSLEVGGFDEIEVQKAFEMYFPMIDQFSPLPYYEREFDDPRTNQGYSLARVVKPDLLESLHHPVVWRSLLNLEEKDRYLALAGDIDAVDLIASDLIKWFDNKLTYRNRIIDLRNINPFALLSEIAKNTELNSFNDKMAWLSVVEPYIGRNLGIPFYNEAMQAGLIESDSDPRWKWRHKFIYEYLTRNKFEI